MCAPGSRIVRLPGTCTRELHTFTTPPVNKETLAKAKIALKECCSNLHFRFSDTGSSMESRYKVASTKKQNSFSRLLKNLAMYSGTTFNN